MFFDKILDALKVENLFSKESSKELPDTSAFMYTEPEPEPEPEPTAQADTDAMLVDHEYRLTLLELGVTEDAV